MKKERIFITLTQAKQFNAMLEGLKLISGRYQTPAQLRKSAKNDYGLSYEEALEMSYENLKYEAQKFSKGVKWLKIPENAKPC